MKDTAKLTLPQVCESMQLYMHAQAATLTDHMHLFPPGHAEEIARLGSAMWAVVLAVKAEAEALQTPLNDPAFAAFKAQLLAKPRRVRKSRKVAAERRHHQALRHLPALRRGDGNALVQQRGSGAAGSGSDPPQIWRRRALPRLSATQRQGAIPLLGFLCRRI